MKTTGVSSIPKFELLFFLGHPNGYTHAKLYFPGVTGFAKLERWGSLIAKDTAPPEAVVKKLGTPLP